ncbi:aminotransferase class V-fold PLP-dependent enzyme [Streptococcus sp. 3167]|uniref:aminotransferase class V-fold PLP-dependent enzyme n=1 Tax=Streptococcus sp. 3167 TaxID=2582649 RepID=UPI001561C647|nr:aminotransferase class V-fold PLP-dependent enzyme [Streptococcus sp. 3167]
MLRNLFSFQTSDIIYFDNAATVPKPKAVVNKLTEVYSGIPINIKRYNSKNDLIFSNEYEAVKKKIKNFLSASNCNVLFTKSATEAYNLLSRSIKYNKGKLGVSVLEHHSNYLPWKML